MSPLNYPTSRERGVTGFRGFSGLYYSSSRPRRIHVVVQMTINCQDEERDWTGLEVVTRIRIWRQDGRGELVNLGFNPPADTDSAMDHAYGLLRADVIYIVHPIQSLVVQ